MSRQTIKKTSIWLLAIGLMIAHVFFRNQVEAGAIADWKQIHSRAGDCRISFPVLPQMIQQGFDVDEKGGRLTYDVYVAPYQDKGLCLLLVAQYPTAIPAGQEVLGLEGLVRGIVSQHPENKLVFAELGEFEGYPALTFMVQSGKNYFRAQAVMVRSKLFMIAMEGRKQHFEENVFQHFLKSFSLIAS
jgi:hypothetical protein